MELYSHTILIWSVTVSDGKLANYYLLTLIWYVSNIAYCSVYYMYTHWRILLVT